MRLTAATIVFPSQHARDQWTVYHTHLRVRDEKRRISRALARMLRPNPMAERTRDAVGSDWGTSSSVYQCCYGFSPTLQPVSNWAYTYSQGGYVQQCSQRGENSSYKWTIFGDGK